MEKGKGRQKTRSVVPAVQRKGYGEEESNGPPQ